MSIAKLHLCLSGLETVTKSQSKENTTEGEEQVKVYIAGKITGNPSYKQQFAEAEKKLREKGFTTMNPAVLPDGFEHQEYMRVCFSMIDVCDAVYFLSNWEDSKGARMEYNYAFGTNKDLMFEEG